MIADKSVAHARQAATSASSLPIKFNAVGVRYRLQQRQDLLAFFLIGNHENRGASQRAPGAVRRFAAP